MGTRTIYRCDVCERDFGTDNGKGQWFTGPYASITYECRPPPDSEKPKVERNVLCCSSECLRRSLETAVALLHEQASAFLLANNCSVETSLRLRAQGPTGEKS